MVVIDTFKVVIEAPNGTDKINCTIENYLEIIKFWYCLPVSPMIVVISTIKNFLGNIKDVYYIPKQPFVRL